HWKRPAASPTTEIFVNSNQWNSTAPGIALLATAPLRRRWRVVRVADRWLSLAVRRVHDRNPREDHGGRPLLPPQWVRHQSSASSSGACTVTRTWMIILSGSFPCLPINAYENSSSPVKPGVGL